jgi:hypothetical protein
VGPVEAGGRLIEAEGDLMREYLLLHDKEEFVVDVLSEEICKLLLSLRILILSNLA